MFLKNQFCPKCGAQSLFIDTEDVGVGYIQTSPQYCTQCDYVQSGCPADYCIEERCTAWKVCQGKSLADTPMANKTLGMHDAIETLFPNTGAAIKSHKCPMCNQQIGQFKDELSEKEYKISGLCQSCQEEVFN